MLKLDKFATPEMLFSLFKEFKFMTSDLLLKLKVGLYSQIFRINNEGFQWQSSAYPKSTVSYIKSSIDVSLLNFNEWKKFSRRFESYSLFSA